MLLLLAIAWLPSCSETVRTPQSEPAVTSQPLAPPGERLESTESSPLFRRISPDDSGITFTNELVPESRVERNNLGTGVASGDIDGDGLTDLYFVSKDGPNRLYQQTSPWRFQDVTDLAGVGGGNASGTGAAFIDVDNDGDLDLYACNQDAADQLFINQGNLRFTEEAAARGTAHPGPSVMVAPCDYDRDGDLDLYITTYRELGAPIDDKRRVTNSRQLPPDLEDDYAVGKHGLIELGREDVLLQNDGAGHFTDVTSSSGIPPLLEFGLSATWFDYNNDDWPDLYVANDFKGPDHLYHNNGDGTFTDVAPQSMPFLPWFAMGSDFGDLNNDGWFDLIVGDMMGTTHFRQKLQMGDIRDTRTFLSRAFPRQYMRNTFFVNTGTGRFLEASAMAGMSASDWTWAIRIADLDCDGREDVFFTNGHYLDARDTDRFIARKLMRNWQNENGAQDGKRFRDYLRGLGFEEEVFMGLDRPPLDQKNLAFRNRGDLQFDDVSDAWGLGHKGVSFGTTLCDLDTDGDLDIVVVNTYEPVSLYQNNGSLGNRMVIRLRGTSSNHYGIGSRLTAHVEDEILSRYLSTGRGYQSADQPEIHFGLGDHQKIDRLEIRWPSGIVQTIENLKAGSVHTIREPDNERPAPLAPATAWAAATPENSATQFRLDEESGLEYRHFEQPYDDFKNQPLLPFQLSALGPGMAWGDADGDGREDLWVGGGFGQLGGIHFKEQDRRFAPATNHSWQNAQADALADDMGGLWFDADGDGDNDLYVVSGGVESPVSGYQDRLYLNDGHGALELAASALPPESSSGSTVSAGDFDRDGDLDLFVGGRSVPGAYPVTPSSRLLINENGRFHEASPDTAPGLRDVGLVTGSLWSDVDGDGWLDLLITLDWGAVTLYINRKGRLINETAERGLGQHLGWWNGIAGSDVDHDGDIDYVATNFGTNTKYKIKEGKPRRIYYGDFDGNGASNIVEAKFEDDRLLPERGRSCSMLAMPMLESKFPTFRKYAASVLTDVYTAESLGQALQREANWLETSLLVNDGSGHFEVRPLPRLAQIAPSFGVALEDFDGDGHVDIVLGQNFYPNQPETGWMNMGLGLYLHGSGEGSFEPVGPSESGILVREDARSLTTADIDDDGWMDFVVALNDGPLRVFRNQGAQENRTLTLKLRGKPGNLNAVGATVTLSLANGLKQVREIYAGGSYLGQSTARLIFGIPQDDEVRKLSIRWPDGKTSDYFEGFEGQVMAIEQK